MIETWVIVVRDIPVAAVRGTQAQANEETKRRKQEYADLLDEERAKQLNVYVRKVAFVDLSK